MKKRYGWKCTMWSGLLSVFILMGGCGQDSSTAPSGSEIIINPSGISWTSGYITSCPSPYYNDTPVTITVRNSEGKNMNDRDIAVTLDLSPNTGSIPAQVVQLYDGATPVSSPYNTRTGDDGTKTLTVRVDLGCEYTVNLNVYSGDAFGSISIEVAQ